MIWELLIGGVYSVLCVILGFLAGWNIRGRLKAEQKSTLPLTKTGIDTPKGESDRHDTTSGALKSITPLERSLEDSAEIRNRIEHLLK